MWNRVMRKHIENGGEHFTYHDIRAKAGSETEDDQLLGHDDPRTMKRHYKRRPLKVKPLRSRILNTPLSYWTVVAVAKPTSY
jgi:hypothetical protein